MKESRHWIINLLTHDILQQFPSLNVSIEVIAETGETFLLIDDEATYYSNTFQAIVTQVTSNLLWPNNIYDIFFAYEEQPERVEYRQFSQTSIKSTSGSEGHFEIFGNEESIQRSGASDLAELSKAA